MVRFALQGDDAAPLEVTGAFVADGIQHPPAVLRLWDQDQLAAVGVLPIQEPPPPPFGHREAGRHLEMSGDAVVEILDLEPIPLGELKNALNQAVRAKRWAVESGGLQVGAATISTDPTSQAKLTGAIMLFDKDPTIDEVDWEAQPNVWVSIDQATALTLGVAVGRHVQACFTRARQLSEAIASAEDAQALSAIDINAGWPPASA